ncbi:MAG: heavy-metal-associated domain-containing protein [Promethearchaeota archaeon]|jgi:copper chaperone CopZ
MVEKMKIRVSGMHCGNCVSKVENKLKNLDGVNKISVNLAKGEVKVGYDPKTTGFNTFQAVIQELGYQASR